MITLHHLEYSQSFRILWLLEELGIDYELVSYERDPVTYLAPESLKQLSPLGSAPVITDGDLVLAETGAIIDYLLDLHPREDLRPPAWSPYRARHLFWFHAAQGSLMPIILLSTLFRIMRQRAPFFIRPIVALLASQLDSGFSRPRLQALLAKAESDLAQAPWFGGLSPSAADMLLSYGLVAAREAGLLDASQHHCRDWLLRIEQLPSFQSARDRDGRESMVLPIKS
jgi:glutathione S-transferase